MEKLKKNILMSSASEKRIRVFSVIAGLLFFGALYLVIFSAVSDSVAYVLGLLSGLIVAALYLIFKKNKLAFWSALGTSLIYTAICAALGFMPFYNGVLNFFNNISATANGHMHWGWSYLEAQPSAVGDFLFSSAVSVWLAFAVASLRNRRRLLITAAVIITFLFLFLGLYPALYSVILLVISVLALLASDRGYTLKTAACYLSCAVVLFGAIAPCCIYSGSDGVRDFRAAIVYSAEKTFYGKDSLPEGNLKKAESIRSSTDVRLEVELTPQIRTLYLKGFVGSELNGSKFKPTDRNAYVENGYHGLIDYIGQWGFPAMQYSAYSALNGSRERDTVTVTNKGANLKYVYSPYTVCEYSAGSVYYDLNIRGGLFTPKKYEFTVFASDKSSERITQAQWLLDGSNRTAAMEEYLAVEQDYRAFVYDEYCKIGDREKEIILSAMGGTQISSINTATQFIRRYFTDNYIYSDRADAVGADFLGEFFGGNIRSATAIYFAAAATYAFRLYGIPARYVEGYLVNPLDASVNTVIVTGKSSHAWTEVYFDGMGWLPVDVTPTFFAEDIPDNPTDPDEPSAPPIDPEAPETPPETPVEPEDPVDPEPMPEPSASTKHSNLIGALKIAVPVLSALCTVTSLWLAVEVRRLVIINKKRKKLKCNGEQLGRSAHAVLERDLKFFGGLSFGNLEKYGVIETDYERFMELVEKSVYGGYDLTANEKSFILYFINNTAEAVSHKGGKLHSLYCKFVVCLGI